jgi:transcriptional regulator with XRE-family HTH domain
MIASRIVAEIQRLLAARTLSQRKIAAMMGVSRGSVAAIASGRRRDGDVPSGMSDDGAAEPAGPPARCPGCGGLVYMPCLLCRLRKERPRAAARSRTAAFFGSTRLDLRPEHRERYEEVRALRRSLRSLEQPMAPK